MGGWEGFIDDCLCVLRPRSSQLWLHIFQVSVYRSPKARAHVFEHWLGDTMNVHRFEGMESALPEA